MTTTNCDFQINSQKFFCTDKQNKVIKFLRLLGEKKHRQRLVIVLSFQVFQQFPSKSFKSPNVHYTTKYTYGIETSAKCDKIWYVYFIRIVYLQQSERKRFKKFIFLNPQYVQWWHDKYLKQPFWMILQTFGRIYENDLPFIFIAFNDKKKLFSAHFI